jgi:hypothetical protein
MPILFTSNSIAGGGGGVGEKPRITAVSPLVLAADTEGALVFSGVTADDTYAWELLEGPADAVLSGETTATATITWTPDENGSFRITLSLTDGAGRATSEVFYVLVVGVDGVLSLREIAIPASPYDLSAGSADFLAFHNTDTSIITTKDGASIISDFALVGDQAYKTNNAASLPLLEWTDGDAPETASGVVRSLPRWAESATAQGVSVVLASSATVARRALLFLKKVTVGAIGMQARVSASFAGGQSTSLDFSTASLEHENVCIELTYLSPVATPLNLSIAHVGTRGAFFLRAIQVLADGSAATLTPSPSTWTVRKGETLNATVTLSGASADGVEISAIGLPPGATFSAAGAVGTFAYTPNDAALGSYVVEFVASTESSEIARLVQTITVQARTENPPVITLASSSWSITPGGQRTFTVTALSNNASAVVSLKASNLPSSAVFVCVPGTGLRTGTIYWTPVAGDVRTTAYNIRFDAVSANGPASTATLPVTVSAT